MRLRFHRFLLALLMLVLPLQGFAFVSMLDVRPPSPPQAMAYTAQTHDLMAGCHEPAPPDGAPEQHDCEHCAACVLGSALPVPLASELASQPVARSFAEHPDTPYSGFVPDGPERPPRPVLA